ncbi:MAG: RAMP superfamily protein [Syntrophorhabdus sp. PtaU1.Bin002]|nr:MAG: RAMP superfamily protein [Syntrophorhabdus sp. PtaU1.Bin002]
MSKPFEQKRYYMSALDPIHVGTGGYRLGRVDNTIVREPGTNIPKVPGSSVAGVSRSFAALRPEVNKYPSCAGKGGGKGSEHCCLPTCPVCVGFGFSNGETNESFQGLVQFSDARILFFPVHSMLGPVWISSESILREHGFDFRLHDWTKFKCFSLDTDRLNFGWLMLEKEGAAESIGTSFSQVPQEVRDRLFMVSDRIFSRIVNDNLEVRTSVAIDPYTGAAEDKALFTYEAIPRGTVLWFDITYQNPEYFKVGASGTRQDIKLTPTVLASDPLGRSITPFDQLAYLAGYVELGLEYIKALGLGGMNTRGFGRAEIIPGGRLS